jgi:hypothetical protein
MYWVLCFLDTSDYCSREGNFVIAIKKTSNNNAAWPVGSGIALYIRSAPHS